MSAQPVTAIWGHGRRWRPAADQVADSLGAWEITVAAPDAGPWRRTALDLPGQDQRAPDRS